MTVLLKRLIKHGGMWCALFLQSNSLMRGFVAALGWRDLWNSCWREGQNDLSEHGINILIHFVSCACSPQGPMWLSFSWHSEKMLLNVNGDYFYMGHDCVWQTLDTWSPGTQEVGYLPAMNGTQIQYQSSEWNVKLNVQLAFQFSYYLIFILWVHLWHPVLIWFLF